MMADADDDEEVTQEEDCAYGEMGAEEDFAHHFPEYLRDSSCGIG